MIWMANVFKTGSTNEILKAVSLYTTSSNANYEIQIYTGLASSGTPTSGTLAHSQTGTQDFAGYHTIPLSSAVNLSANSSFAVVVKMRTPGFNYPAAVEAMLNGYSNNFVVNPGESFFSSDAVKWSEGQVEKANVCIRAFTVNGGSGGNPDPIDPDPIDPDPTPPTTPTERGSGSSGCNAGLGLLLMPLVAVIFTRRR